MEVDFKPSDVLIFASVPPLVGTFGRTEHEAAAAYMVRTLAVTTNVWGPVDPRSVGEMIQKEMAEKTEFAKLMNNPFLRPDAYGLVKSGFAEWTSEEGKAVQFTLKGLEALRRWVRKG